MFFGKKKSSTPGATTAPTPAPSTGKVDLKKSQDALDGHIVRLQKEKGVDLTKHRARVFVALDISGSMSTLFQNGSVQSTLTRLLPIALKFDDNGELEVFVFNHDCTQMPAMNIHNYKSYVQDVIIRNGYGPSGGTSYAPVIRQTMKAYDDGSPYPAFGIFITDGENSDPQNTDEEVRKSSKKKIFYQFVGIGNEYFRYLQKLDDLDGRDADNTAFVKIADLGSLTDNQLYSKLLEQYPDWLRAMGIK
ncbi:MAG: VWA domain-containing protein [Clostridia bacterium]|nr:VWA domain-containing protein [Clostridia bacterium]